MNQPKRILVTGANSQLGKTLQLISPVDFNIDFFTKKDLDIIDRHKLEAVCKQQSYDYCFNFAAYTDVEKAETDARRCHEVNVTGVKHLALAANRYNFGLIHISTDYVFDGKKTFPYTETDTTAPLNVYGKSKLLGEREAQKAVKHYIIRTSWLYSAFNKNFVKTILALAQKKSKLNLVADQTGTPTAAGDLIDFILYLVRLTAKNPKNDYTGIYHFSDEGATSWFDFGKEILALSGQQIPVEPVSTQDFPVQAPRPAYSVLSHDKIINRIGYMPPHWQEALKNFFKTYKNF